MSLLDLWKSSPEQIKEKQVQQLISFAGEGQLKDSNKTSHEFRELIANLPTIMIKRYIDECLSNKFDDNGFALQDIINEIGSRLGFSITNGRYRGIKGENGFDGLWDTPEGNQIVVEVKTTDVYRIDLNKIASYRKTIIHDKTISEDKISILIVVGRQDTGDLEAQIRGSKHAWDIRLISVEALLRLLSIKEEIEDPNIESRIRTILIPREYTRLDDIIDLAFSTAENIKLDDVNESEVNQDGEQKFSSKDKFNEECALRISKIIGRSLIKQSKVLYSTSDKTFAIICAVSKEYDSEKSPNYWYAFYPHQRNKLESYKESFIAFGCGSPDRIIKIPYKEFSKFLDGMHQTHRNGTSYWHVSIYYEDGKYMLHRKKGFSKINLSQYLI